MMSEKYIKAGACFDLNNGNFQKCALQPLDCASFSAAVVPSESIFHSTYWLSINNQDIFNQCSQQDDTFHKIKSVGRCEGISDRFICTSDKSACRFSSVFKPHVTDCDIVHDYLSTNTFSYTHYGFCVDWSENNEPNFCAWRFKECGAGGPEGWQWRGADPFFANQNPECHCDDGRT